MGSHAKLIQETRDLIDSVRSSRSRAGFLRDRSANPAAIKRRVSVDEAVERSIVDPVDATVEITIADDRMTASASFYPPRGFGRPIDPSTVYERLALCGVSYGINAQVIDAGVETCNLERCALHAIEVAFGAQPQDQIPEHVEVVDRTPAPPDPEEDDGVTRVDHRSRSRLQLVREGDVLARVVPAVTGRPGRTVTGEELPYQTIQVPSLVAGANTTLSDTDIVADVGGLLHLEHGEISVSPTLVLRDGIDNATGNVDFVGDVLLAGRIHDGFTLRCTGTLHAGTTIDVFGIECGALVCSQGVIGRSPEPLTVRDDARLRFVQNARLEAGGTLQILQSALKSHLTAARRIEFGPRSSVVGCTIRASEGVVAYDIGAPGAAVTEIYLGIDFEVDERLAGIRDQTLQLSQHLRDVRLAKRHAPEDADFVTIESEITATIASLAEEAGDLVSHLDREEDAELVVRGTVYSGTYIEICHRSYMVEQTMRRCRFRIDRARGSVTVEKLTERERER